MIRIDPDTERRLMAMPVNQTLALTIDDRNFTVIDTEFFYDICRLARLEVEPTKA